LPPPKEKHTKHLDYKGVRNVLHNFTYVVVLLILR